jgi:putative peptidoglycan lipid II flippase
VSGLLLLLALRRSAGPQVLTGLGRSAGAGVAGAAVALGAGALVPDLGPALLTGAVVALVAVAAYLLVARQLDADGLRELRRA